MFSRALLASLTVLPILLLWPAPGSGNSNPVFYLATDRSFTEGETPYVNLESSGRMPIQMRLYRVRDPETFLLKQTASRIVREQDGPATANAFALMDNAWAGFKQEFRQIARKELSAGIRSELRAASGIALADGPVPPREPAQPGQLAQHEFLRAFEAPLTDRDWTYRRVPVPVESNGVYILQAISGPHVAYTVIVRSRLTFLTKQSERSAVVYAADAKSGTPAADAQVALFDAGAGALLARGATDSQGVFRYPGASPDRSLVIVRKGDEFAVSDPDYFTSSFYGAGGPRAYIYTDRPIYRPGDTVYFKAILRNFENGRYRPGGGAASYSVLDERGALLIDKQPLNVAGAMGSGDASFALPAHENVNLGTYNVVVHLGGKSFSAEFRVDAYRKPRYRVNVNLPRRVFGRNDRVDLRINGAYYYGKPLANAQVNVRVFRTPKYDYSPVGSWDALQLAAYMGSTGGSMSRELVLDRTATLDGDGELELTLKPENIDKDYNYSVLASVTAPDQTVTGAGGFSVNRSQFYLRVQRESQVFSPGETAKFTVQLVPYDTTLSGEALKKIIGGVDLAAGLYLRSFVWISEEGRREQIARVKAVTNAQGRAEISVRLPRSGHYALNIEAEDPDGETTSNEVTLWCSGRSDTIETPVRNITLTPGKDAYRAGETAEVLILSPVADAHVFISIEGDRLYRQETIEMKGNVHRYRVPITEEMTPNFVFSAALFHGGQAYKSELKIVAPPQDKFLRVSVKPDRAVYRPGDTVRLEVSALDAGNRGVAAEVSLGVVDAALYALANDPAPAMTSFFYHPRRNNVITSLSNSYRFFGYSEERRLQLALNRRGIAALTALKEEPEARRNFRDQTYWNARIQTNRDGKATVSFQLADNLTEWRVTARAITADTRVGEATASFIARKELQINAGVPRFMLEGQDQVVAANLSNLTTAAQNVVVSLSAENGTIKGASSQSVELAANAEGVAYFTVSAGEGASLKLRFKAIAGALSDASEHVVPLQTAGLRRTTASYAVLQNGAARASMDVNLPQSMRRPVLRLRLNPGSGVAVRQALSYLADYPYGCIEQTMSRFLPLLAAQQIGYVTPRLRNEMPRMIDAGVGRLRQFQNADGGFGWYGGVDSSDPMMTAYVFRGLALSRKFGRNFEDRLIDHSSAYLYRALSETQLDAFSRAYILFSLSEASPIPASMLDALKASASEQTHYGRALIALTLYNSGRAPEARALALETIQKSGVADDANGIRFTLPLHLNVYGAWNEDRVELTAALLTAAVRLNLDGALQEKLAATLLANRTDGIAWKNSRDTAFAVLALAEKLKAARETDSPAILRTLLNGVEVRSLTASPGALEDGELIVEIPRANLRAGRQRIELIKESGPPVYAAAVAEYFDAANAFAPSGNQLSVERRYERVQVSRTDDRLELSVSGATEFKQGDLVMVTLRVRADSGAGTYYQVEDPIPPGFSVVQSDSEYFSQDRRREYENRQLYDDRAVFFAPGPQRELTVRYFLRADLPGAYRALPARGFFMYYPELYASSADTRLTIHRR